MFVKHKRYTAAGHPPPINSPGARVLLWDSEQTAAYYAGTPVPPLPTEDDGEDLLDRNEAAALLEVSAKSWDTYKHTPEITPHLVKVKGVEHCPRRIVTAYRSARQAGPGDAAKPGRPHGSGDMVPRDEIPREIGALLEEDPAVTSKTVMTELGLSYVTVTRTLARLRGEHIADLITSQPDLTPQDAARQLGYPTAVHRTAIAHAQTEIRARAARPYIQEIADTLAGAGLAEHQDVTVTHLADDHIAAALVLSHGAPAPALVWDERSGWRTATSRRHPIRRNTGQPPQGEPIGDSDGAPRPAPAQLLAALTARTDRTDEATRQN
ncbi:DUF6292 family protein [Streptomyces sp. YIM 130001]|uniref:DUF6292 family protein n=1 Tax=Streptomyces sp. YIM 130001 TaxID=2259644 RepID=UPI001F093A2A|nr:DUF6292 family protein [Streptomyces sp. YIM 130001]